MDILLLILIVAVFILPSFFMMRTQRRRQAELQNMQASIQSGDRVVTVSGIHGTIVGVRDTQLDVELAPGLVVVMDRIAVLRRAETAEAGIAGAGGYESTYDASTEEQGFQHPEHPAQPEQGHFPEHPENRPTDGGHPENR
ncbi:preprotein translocase subunit YajC [Corynebacterium comes]|uniref:Preprotein translocase subunit YajC n=1 Tax=Corynebacterium comes TaxID=2675218 RepID=A0A6B8VKY1_9CORY|nr:preprotein translocase subunit YajC [Corynebacterium comes]QGU04743.1 preprotein translocase subunit YajC [Corynebacterium comes]